MNEKSSFDTVGVILAGGKSRRMGIADKCLLPFMGKPMLEQVIQCAQPQVAQLCISANGDPTRFAHFGLPIVADIYPNQAGPLAGIISAMSFLYAGGVEPRWLATFPCDTPLAPQNWVAKLKTIADINQLDVVIAADSINTHYTHGIWSYQTLAQLRSQFSAGERSLHRVIASLRSQVVVCHQHPYSFFNINTPDDFELITTYASATHLPAHPFDE